MTAQQTSLFRASAVASGLLTDDDLAAAERRLRDEDPQFAETDRPPSDQQLAVYLTRIGRLNTWQVQQLLAGRTKFTLGPYHIVDSIGQGGMGQVFKAEHSLMGRTVAIKVLPRHKSTPEAVAAFEREIRAQAQLDHHNLVRALDAGHDGNVHYLVTEYVPCVDLRKLVRRRQRLGVPAAAAVISQAASGLGHAHSKGLIHRDIKPGNLLVTVDGQVKVSDLGLVGTFDEESETDENSGKIVGTADYLSPEQVAAPRTVGPASDVYSLGCTLYYAVTGKVPFPGGTTADKCRAHCQLQPLDPRRLNPTLSADFVDVIAEMMVKDAQSRLPTAAAVIERLAPFTGEDLFTALAQEIAEAGFGHEARQPQPPPLVGTEGRGAPRAARQTPGHDLATNLPMRATRPVSASDEETLPTIEPGPEPPLAHRRGGDVPLWLRILIVGAAVAVAAALGVFLLTLVL